MKINFIGIKLIVRIFKMMILFIQKLIIVNFMKRFFKVNKKSEFVKNVKEHSNLLKVV